MTQQDQDIEEKKASKSRLLPARLLVLLTLLATMILVVAFLYKTEKMANPFDTLQPPPGIAHNVPDF